MTLNRSSSGLGSQLNLESLDLASENGDGSASYQLGRFYESCSSDVANTEKAFAYYTLAVNQGQFDACIDLATAYQAGRGVEQSSKTALAWLHIGAESEHLTCQLSLADAYRIGRGTPIDLEQSFNWYQKAALKGCEPAQFRLGQAYLYGKGVPRNSNVAYEWFEKSAAQGNIKARKLADSLASKMGQISQSDKSFEQPSPKSRQTVEKDDVTAVLIDTSVLLVDPDVIVRILAKQGLPFVTDIILAEVDKQKSAEKGTGFNARRLLRSLANKEMTELTEISNGKPLKHGDALRQCSYQEKPLFILSRTRYQARDSNDSRILEVARDYRMVIITRDAGLEVRAKSIGIEAHLWSPPVVANPPTTSHVFNQTKTIESPKPFANPKTPISEPDVALRISAMPQEGDVVTTIRLGEFRLTKTLSAGGEGTIFSTDHPDVVCKVYHKDRLTALRQKKIELMLSRKVDAPGICWPKDVALNRYREFVGYIMPKAKGKTVQSTMFVKPLLEKNFPDWTRLDLVNVCNVFLEQIAYLHSLNIIVGDINPMNLLVEEDSKKLWLVDTDSFQIEAFPCQVGTVNFTAPEIQGQNYSSFLRTKDHELFAVATMLFMLLHPGKPPYAQQGGGDPAANIRAMDFSYPHGGKANGKAPEGPWQNIWGNLIKAMREGFWSTFKENKRLTIKDWQIRLIKYHWAISNGHNSNELFPTTFKIFDPINVECGQCKKIVPASKRRVKKLADEGKAYYCGECQQQNKLRRLAIKAHRDQQGTNPKAARPSQQQRFTRVNNQKPTQQPRTSSSQSNTNNALLSILFNFFK